MRYSPMVMGAAAIVVGAALIGTTPSDAALTSKTTATGALNPVKGAIQLARANDYDCTRYSCRKKPRAKKPERKGGSRRSARLIPDGRGGWCYRMRSGGYYCPDG